MNTRPEDCQNMTELREAIDTLDGEIVSLLVKRALLIDRAAEIKLRDNLPAHIQSRVDEVVENVKAHARKHALDEELVGDIWQQLIAWSIDRENKAMGT